MAMYSAILLAHENQELQASHEKKLQKGRRSRKQIATEEGLSVQEGRDLIQGRSQMEEAIPTVSTEPAPAAERHHTQAPPRCSDCHIIGHRRLQCPNRNGN